MDFGYKKMYINGTLQDGNASIKQGVTCPGTEDIVAQVAWANEKDALSALESAKEGFEVWKNMSLAERTKWMLKLRDALISKEELLREAVMYEMGKPYSETAEDFEIIDALEYYPNAMRFRKDTVLPDMENTHSHKVISQPAGVVVAYLPWNFPLLCLGFKLAPALAAGCSIIIKPSPYSPLSAYLIGEICHEIGFPKGVITIFCGPNEIANVLSSSKIPRVVTMIGSSKVAKIVTKESSTSIKRYSLELGGNAPFIVFPDADIEQAAKDVTAIKFGNCGQICVTPNRVFIHSEVATHFKNELINIASNQNLGFGREFEPTMGPLISKSAMERVDKTVKSTIKEGANLVYGGERDTKKNKGYFYQPTIIENVNESMEIFKNEIFGPVISIISFDDEKEVVRMANKTEFGLSSFLYTKDAERIQRISKELDFGEIMINGFKWSINLPHMGIKESGIGADCSTLALEPYLVKKRITQLRSTFSDL